MSFNKVDPPAQFYTYIRIALGSSLGQAVGCPLLYRAPFGSPHEYRNFFRQTDLDVFIQVEIAMKQDSGIKIFRYVTPCRLVNSYRLILIIYNKVHIYVQIVQLKSGPYFNMSNLFTKIYNMLYYTTNLYLQ